MALDVIVPLDGSEHARRAVPHGRWLAGRRGGDLVLVSVVDHIGAAADAQRALEAELSRVGTPGQAVVRCGPDVAHELLEEAGARPDAALCVATRAGARLPAALLTSVTAALLHESPCPLVLVGPACADAVVVPEAMVAFLDGSDFAERIVPLVDVWAAQLGLEVWLAEVVGEAASRVIPTHGGDVTESGYLSRCAHG
jgi:nucleotide-binding universal stress UspA family protein